MVGPLVGPAAHFPFLEFGLCLLHLLRSKGWIGFEPLNDLAGPAQVSAVDGLSFSEFQPEIKIVGPLFSSSSNRSIAVPRQPLAINSSTETAAAGAVGEGLSPAG